MSGQSIHVGCKRPREVFQTSLSSLSFSSLSSSFTSSSDDAIEIITKASRTSYEDQIRGKVSKAYSPPSSSRPIQLMNRCLGTHYNPERIPASVFAKTGGDLNWSEVSNDSLFSLRMSTCQTFRPSNIIPEDGEFLAYSPSLLVMPEEAEEEKGSQEAKSVVMMTSVKPNTHRERSIPQVVTCSFDQLYQAPLRKSQAFPLALVEKKNMKRKKTRRRSKKTYKKEKTKEDMCCIWSWLCSCVSKCKCNYKWRSCCCCCCCGAKSIVIL